MKNVFGVAAGALITAGMGYVVYRDHEKQAQIADLAIQLKKLNETVQDNDCIGKR